MDRRVYISLFLTIMATALGASMVLPLLPVYAQSLGAGGFELGLIFSAFALARLFTLPMVGGLAEVWGRRRFMLLGLFCYSLVAVGFAAADSVSVIVLCRLLQGAAAAMVIPVARAYAGDLSRPGEEGRLMGHFNMAFFGGLACGPWLGGFFKDFWGIQAAFYAMSVLALAGLALSFKYLPRASRPLNLDAGAKDSYFAMLRQPELAAMFLFRFGSIIGLGVNWTFLPLYGHHLHLSASRIGVLISVTVVMTTLLQPYFGRMADRVDRPRMAFWGGFLASLGLLAIPFCGSFLQILVVNLLLGSAMGMYMPPLMAMAVDAGRRAGFMTRVMSLLEMAFSCGMIVGPLLAGLVKEVFGLQAIFWTGGSIGAASCFLFLWIMQRRRPAAPLESEESW
jgi:MFS family permease